MATVTVLVPAHNEEQGIASTIEGLLNQRTPEWLKITDIVIVANNCTDRTAEIARRYPVTVQEMLHNQHKKSGAMNVGWASCGRDSEYVLTMDADTVLLPDTVAGMAAELVEDGTLGAVCARYWAKEGARPAVAAAAPRVRPLRRHARAARMARQRRQRRCGHVPAGGAAAGCRIARKAEPWDNASLIEDYALTLDLKTLEWRVASGRAAHVYTEPAHDVEGPVAPTPAVGPRRDG